MMAFAPNTVFVPIDDSSTATGEADSKTPYQDRLSFQGQENFYDGSKYPNLDKCLVSFFFWNPFERAVSYQERVAIRQDVDIIIHTRERTTDRSAELLYRLDNVLCGKRELNWKELAVSNERHAATESRNTAVVELELANMTTVTVTVACHCE